MLNYNEQVARIGMNKKNTFIQSEFERLYDPNHQVRNNLETLDSVEEVRIIKEALK
jgi:hypothetical protein